MRQFPYNSVLISGSVDHFSSVDLMASHRYRMNQNPPQFSWAQCVDYEVGMIRVSWKIGHAGKFDSRNHPLNHRDTNLRRLEGNTNENKQKCSLIYMVVSCKILWACVIKVCFFGKIPSKRNTGSRCIKSILNLFVHRVTRRSKLIILLGNITLCRKCLNTL